MPVLSEPHNGIANLPGARISYLFLGVICAFFLFVFYTRRQRSLRSREGETTMSLPTHMDEKSSMIASEEQSASEAKQSSRIADHYQPPPSSSPINDASPSFPSSPISYEASQFDAFGPSPRRRSYTKPTPDGGEVSGEIIVAEGWRRHTRVFGGGVCKACEESERRMTA